MRLVVGQKVYTLQAHENDLNKFAGQQLMIKAAVSGDTTRQIAIREATLRSRTMPKSPTTPSAPTLGYMMVCWLEVSMY
jgi:hypothetical protein